MSTSKSTQATSANSNRRRFFRDSSLVVAGSAVASQLPIERFAHAAGSDTIRIGLVGCGGRGTGAAIQAMDTGNVKLVAMADAFDRNISAAFRSIKSKHGEMVDVPDERRFTGLQAYKGVMASDCDLVILATPPGFRPMHFEAAVEAGKHVFMEKPVASDAPGVRRVLAANELAKKKQLAVAVGLQRHHESGYKAIIEKLQEGAIGDIILARAYWNSNGVWIRNRKREQTELMYQVENWYYFNWLSGDHIVEQHIHNLDVINWLMQGYPVAAQGQGGRQVRTQADTGQIYDHHFVEFTYGNQPGDAGTKMLSQCRHIEGCWNSVEEYAHGTKGWANISGGKIHAPNGEVVWEAPRNEDGWANEHVDLFAALRRGEIPNEGDYGAYSTMTAIMGRLATYSGKRLTWDECLNSKIALADFDSLQDWDSPAPLLPDENGRYEVPQPGGEKSTYV